MMRIKVADDNDEDCDSSQRGCLGNLTGVTQCEDLYAQGTGVRTVQQDGRGQLAHGGQENQEEACHHGGTDQRQRYVFQGFRMGRAAGPCRFFQGRMHLLQRGGGALHGEGQVTGHVGYQDDQDNADSQYGAGNGIRKHGEHFQNFFPFGFDLNNNIRHHNAQEHTDDTGGDGQEQGIADGIHGRLAGCQILEVFQRKVFRYKRQAIGFDQAFQEDHYQRNQYDDDQSDDR